MPVLFKKMATATWMLVVIIALGAYFYFTDQIDQMLGGNTEQVDPFQFEPVQGDVAITNVQVLSEDATFMRQNMTVLIAGDEIIEVAQHPDLAAHIQVIDGGGRFVIPGLIDSHVHLKKSRNDLLLYIANGVTQVGEMTGMPHQFDYIEEIEQGAAGPGIFMASPKVSSQSGWYATIRSVFEQRQQNFPTPEKARTAVADYQRQGYQAIKLSSDISREVYEAINAEALKLGMPVIGHLPVGLQLQDLYESGQSQLSHVDSITHNLMNEWGGLQAGQTDAFLAHVEAQADEIAAKFKQKGIVLSSTVWLHKTLEQQAFELADFYRTVEIDYQNPGWLEGSALSNGCLPGGNSYEFRNATAEQAAQARENRQTYNQAIAIHFRALLRQGVTITAGTDALGACGMIAGFSLHRELAEMHRLGMTQSQVLRSATEQSAQWMGIKTGLIKAGFRADLLLLNDNPLLDISHTRNSHAVMARGRYYDRENLDQMLRQVKQANDNSREIDITHLKP